MSDNVSILIRMADGTRKADVTVPPTLTIEQMLNVAQEKWNLPSNTDYVLRLNSNGAQLNGTATLAEAGVQNNDILEIFPNLEAG